MGFAGLFILGFSIVLIWKIYQTQKFKLTPFVPQNSDFKLQPPTLALTGKVEQITREVKKRSREDKDFREIKTGEKIIQGEILSTGEKARVEVVFPGFVKLKIQPNSEIGFSDLIAEEFLLSQRNGSVTYEFIDSKNTLSVRSLHLLSAIQTGITQINVESQQGRVTLENISGKTKIAYVNSENKTQVLELTKGKTIFDDTTHTIQTVP